ncbi:acid phosphatase [Ascosphaera apis ARSEF 7405]|uniref:3-phytase n=1 Tax=Ascosphaera apis ARSEF 7405 TaxID=392613 RepID=A0A168C9N4_9EURO|nr:acid phosphatase [Ascosphaera apis ARSEF 7405]
MRTTAILSTLSAVGVSLAYTPPDQYQKPLSGERLSQQFQDDFNILKYTGGRGPYTDRRSAGVSRETPEQCTVDQVVMLMRHGERYPEPADGAKIDIALAKVKQSGKPNYKGKFEFLNDWEYWVPDYCQLEAETFSGPYAGLNDAYNRGTIYRARYGHLLDTNKVTPYFTSGYSRVINTARKFGEGFFGYNYSSSAALNIISEDESQGANSLTPGCFKGTNVDDLIAEKCDKFQDELPQLKAATARLNKELPGAHLNTTDTFFLMATAMFELNARPWSPWINVFTPEEWVAFNYVNGLWFYHCFGPGNPYQVAVGSVFANATLTALNEGPEKHPLLLNFAHDTQISPLVGALGLLDDGDLPHTHMKFLSPWQITDIVPMGAHIVFERLNCSETGISEAGTYVRVILNEGVIPLNDCQNGPGFSCSLKNFTEHYQKKLPDYVDKCGVPKKYPQHFDMWWNYNTTNDLNYQKGPITCASGQAME